MVFLAELGISSDSRLHVCIWTEPKDTLVLLTPRVVVNVRKTCGWEFSPFVVLKVVGPLVKLWVPSDLNVETGSTSATASGRRISNNFKLAPDQLHGVVNAAALK